MQNVSKSTKLALLSVALTFISAVSLSLYFKDSYTKNFNENTTSISVNTHEVKHRKENLIIVTRIHQSSANSVPSLEIILDFVKNSISYASKVLICVRFFSFFFFFTFVKKFYMFIK
jgi:hypothetical protein